MIYFDHNATTPLDERVLDTMLPFMKTYYGNPSSLYRIGRLVRSAIDSAREQVAHLVNVPPNQIIFTSGGTEANNLALSMVKPSSRFAISSIEHPSIYEPAEALVNYQSCHLKKIQVNPDGLINDEDILKTVEFEPTFVSMMLANNETGVIQDLASHALKLKPTNTLIHTDAVQALGKIPVDFQQLNVDLMSLSSHKIYGPKGCGALVFAKNINLQPNMRGGGQEQALRAGTENVPAIIGFGKAAELAGAELAQHAEYLTKLKTLLENNLNQLSQVKIFSAAAPRLPNTVQFSVSGMDGEMLLMKLDQKGIAVSSGSACASGGGKPSPVLKAMGIAPEVAKSAIRISLGKTNTEAQLIEFIDIFKTLIK